MTLTIELPAEAVRRLEEKAAQRGERIEVVASTTLAAALEREAHDLQDAAEGIQRGLDDFVAGRSRSFQEFAAEQRRKHRLAGSE